MPLHWPMSNLNVFCPSIEAKFYRVQQGILCTYLPFLLTVFASNGWFGFTLLNCLFQFKPLKFKSLQILLRWSREEEKKKKKGISSGIFQSTINSGNGPIFNCLSKHSDLTILMDGRTRAHIKMLYYWTSKTVSLSHKDLQATSWIIGNIWGQTEFFISHNSVSFHLKNLAVPRLLLSWPEIGLSELKVPIVHANNLAFQFGIPRYTKFLL